MVSYIFRSVKQSSTLFGVMVALASPLEVGVSQTKKLWSLERNLKRILSFDLSNFYSLLMKLCPGHRSLAIVRSLCLVSSVTGRDWDRR